MYRCTCIYFCFCFCCWLICCAMKLKEKKTECKQKTWTFEQRYKQTIKKLEKQHLHPKGWFYNLLRLKIHCCSVRACLERCKSFSTSFHFVVHHSSSIHPTLTLIRYISLFCFLSFAIINVCCSKKKQIMLLSDDVYGRCFFLLVCVYVLIAYLQ